MKQFILMSLMILATLSLVAQTAVIPTGSGTVSDPYQIQSWENLYWMSVKDSTYTHKTNAHYIQTVNITFPEDITTWNDSLGWNCFGYSTLNASTSFPFRGTYNGQGHTISNLYINRPDETGIGFFASTNRAEISNLGFEGVNVIGDWGPAGIVGEIDDSTRVINCFVKGTITGSSYVGGITSYNNASIIKNCYFIGSIVGVEGMGGITGCNDAGLIENCYVAGTVPNGDLAGVLVGSNDSATISNSFWDTDLAGTIPGIGDNSEGTLTNVLGKTTAQMKTDSTFTNAGWDFVTTWKTEDNINNGYPALIWEVAPSSVIDVPATQNSFAVLHSAYPNPFNPTTNISFDLAKNSQVSIAIYNAKGQKVKTLVNGNFNAGSHQLTWNGKDDNNNSVASGFYFYKMQAGAESQVKKMVMIK